MDEGPSRAEFTTQIERVYDAIRDSRQETAATLRDGFAGVHGRLDMLNGRTRTLEADAVGELVRLADLQRQIERLPCIEGTLKGCVAPQPSAAPPIGFTKREAGIVGFFFMVTAILLEAVRLLIGLNWGKLLPFVKPGG